MVTLRKVTLAAMLGASLAVLGLAAYLFWNSGNGQQLNGQTGDIELLILILLASSALYAIVFALSSYWSAIGFARQADRSIASIREQLSGAMSDLQELQVHARTLLNAQPQPVPETKFVQPVPASAEPYLAELTKRVAVWDISEPLDPQRKLELSHYESAAAYVELTGSPTASPSIASLYRRFAELYAPLDKNRQRFYLERALSLCAADSRAASEIHYDLACWFADNRDFSHALGELALAFQHQSKAMDDRLAQDIEEGGRLYQLASTPPFDKALNDLLLNMSIGIG